MERQNTPTGPGEQGQGERGQGQGGFGEQSRGEQGFGGRSPEGGASMGAPTESGQRPDDIAEMEITEPTITWLEVSHPQQPIPIGENDRVLDSRFNEQHDVWEVLLVAIPDEEESEDE